MGYSVGIAFLLGAPPAVAAVPYIIANSWIADRTHTRAPWMILQAVLGVVGLLVTGYAKPPGVRYFGCFIGIMASNASIPTSLAWQANNIRGQSLRM